MNVSAARKLIANTEALLIAPEGDPKAGSALAISIHHLGAASEVILTDRELFESVLALHDTILSYRGKGSQVAAKSMSRLLCYLTTLLYDQFSRPEKISSDLFPEPHRSAVTPKESIAWTCLQMLNAQAKVAVQGPPSRSQHLNRLRAEAWERLQEICQIVDDPEIRQLAMKAARNTRATPMERRFAVELLPYFVAEDEEPDDEIVKTLDDLAASPTDQSLLRGVLQAQIDLGLESELGALFTMDEWKAEHEDD